MSQKEPKYLIITADDFGYSRERDDGILQCYQQGAITTASVMMNGHSVESAVRLAMDHNMPLDLHLNLTEGRPIRSGTCSSFTDEAGLMLGKMGFREAVVRQQVSFDEIRREIQAQIDKFRDLTGHIPLKVDGHQHVHVIPGVCEVFAEVLEHNGIRMSRLPIEENIAAHSWSSRQQMEFMTWVVQQALQAHHVFSKHHIWAPGFVGLKTMGRDMTVSHLQLCILDSFNNQSGVKNVEQLNCPETTKVTGSSDLLVNTTVALPSVTFSETTTGSEHNTLARKSDVTETAKISKLPSVIQQSAVNRIVCELMVHPGNRTGSCGGCGAGPDDFSQSPDREHEMEILRDARMTTFYSENSISLISFANCCENGN